MKKTKSAAWYESMRNKKHGNQYTKAKELGLPRPQLSEEQRKKKSELSKLRKHTEETKEKIRQKRIAFLRDNPEMVPYKLNHYSKGRSYPEEYWKAVLDSHDLSYQEQYQIGTYQLDFAFPEIKLDLEIDGEQHYVDERISQSDKRRNEWLTEQGWTIIRVRWSHYKKCENKKTFVSQIVQQIMDRYPNGYGS